MLRDEDPDLKRSKLFRMRTRMFINFLQITGYHFSGYPAKKVKYQRSLLCEISNTVIPKVLQKGATSVATRLESRMFLYHDNASAHMAARTVTYMNDKYFQMLEHPHYSPDLGLYDFSLFSKLKKGIPEKLFSRIQDITLSVLSELRMAYSSL